MRFGRGLKTWAYRRIYSGKVKVIATAGRMLIPVTEVNTLLKSANTYAGAR